MSFCLSNSDNDSRGERVDGSGRRVKVVGFMCVERVGMVVLRRTGP